MLVSSTFYVFGKALPTANRMIADTEKYDYRDRFKFAVEIMDFMRRHARTETLVFGKENIPKDEGFVMYSNHQGKYDALGIMLYLGQPTSVLWEKKAAGRFLSMQMVGLLDAVPIDLEDPRDIVHSINKCIDIVNSGRNMLIFPEGGYTDTNHNDFQEFKTGCMSVSLKTKSIILPICIYDSYKSMNSNTFEKVVTEVHFLKPIPYEEYKDLKKKDLTELVKSRIEAKMIEIKREHGSL